MKEHFGIPQTPDRQKLFEELADILQLKTSECLEMVEGIEEISFWIKPPEFSHTNSQDEYDDDMISGKIVTQFRDKLPTVKDNLMEWFGAIEIDTEGDDLYMISVIQEHVKPIGWHAESERLITPEMPEMPGLFKIYLTSRHESWDEWLKNTGLIQ